LVNAGYTNLRPISDPSAVVASVLSEGADVVLLDLHMPGLDGIAVMKALSEALPGPASVPIVVLTADVTRESRDRALRAGAKDFLVKPLDPTEVVLRVGNLLETRALHLSMRAHSERLQELVGERTTAMWSSITRVQEVQEELRLSRHETVARLAIAAELRDTETGAHIERMSRYCALLARASGSDELRAELIRLASQMHDVGKIGIPDSVLLKPGALTSEERTVMETHTDIGHRILAGSRSELLQLAATIALTHHERFDGGGYPRNLSADDIPLVGRIAAIADVFDALTSRRVYRGALQIVEALGIMAEGRGTRFDAVLLEAFFDTMPEVLEIQSEQRHEDSS
jgi:putative two-component system response regulator